MIYLVGINLLTKHRKQETLLMVEYDWRIDYYVLRCTVGAGYVYSEQDVVLVVQVLYKLGIFIFFPVTKW